MKIAILGYGAMGKVMESTIAEMSNLELVGIVDPYSSEVLPDLSDLTQTPDVIVDFSHPDNLESLLNYALNNHVNLVIATTNHSPEQLDLIENVAKEIAIVKTSNTSLGINLLLEAVKLITPSLVDDFDIEIIEKHHNQKIDAPSGTAKMILNEINEATNRNWETKFGREGISPRSDSEIGVHSLRGGTISGEHTVIYAGDDEIIEIKHTALSKKIFARGALKAIDFLKNQRSGLYQMKDVIFKGR